MRATFLSNQKFQSTKMKTIIKILCCLLLSVGVNAQKIKGVASLALLKGNSENNAQALGGISFHKKNASVALLSGFDGYKYSSVPVMLSFNNAFGKKLNRPFVFVNGGYNAAAVNAKQKTWYWDAVSPVKYKAGYIVESGVGYKLLLPRNRSLNFSLGYSLKTINTQYEFQQWNGFKTVRDTRSFEYKLRRIMMKCAIDF
jgi:hypothetical protein